MTFGRNDDRGPQTQGALQAGVNVEDQGGFLASMLLGFFVLLRTKAEPVILQGAARAARDHMERLRI